MEGSQDLELKFKSEAIADLWQEHCALHTQLFELTCDEYVHLLASDMEELDQVIEDKKALIGRINQLEDKRQLLVQELNNNHPNAKIEKMAGLILFLKSKNMETDATRIEKLNLVLMDIIDKIQNQNKKNQLYLNKALVSLKELKESFGGPKKQYNTYGSNGAARNDLRR
ncbi:MAG: flagellar protein FlgN [Bacteriovoracaceae bacterium]